MSTCGVVDVLIYLMADNVEYGFDPHDDSDYLIIHGNDVWGNGKQWAANWTHVEACKTNRRT